MSTANEATAHAFTTAALEMSEMSIDPAVLVWQFGSRPGNLTAQNQYTANSGYNMLCLTNGEYLTFGDQTLGINLAFTTNPDVRKTHFRLPDHQERPILTGEPANRSHWVSAATPHSSITHINRLAST